MTSSAAVVLAGGRSSRMGTPKAALEWHGSTLLRHVTGIAARVVDEVVIVVRAPGQTLPELDRRVVVLDDPEEGLGPLQGLAVGLAAAAEHAEHVFACSTDLPFLHPAFVRAVLDGFALPRNPPSEDQVDGDDRGPDVVLPVVGGYRQPMAAGYRTDLASRVRDLLAAGKRRPAHLFESCRVRQLTEHDLLGDPRLRAADPDLRSVVNVNEPEDYRLARKEPAPEVLVERFGVLARSGRGAGGAGAQPVRAGTVEEAARQVGLALDGHVLAALNGDQVRGDGLVPLAQGDTVAFLSADAGG